MEGLRASVGAAFVWALCAGAVILTVTLLAVSGDRQLPDDLFGGVGGLSFAMLSLAFATVGAIIIARVPGNAVGRVFLAIGLLNSIGQLAYQYAAWGLARPGGAPGIREIAWLTTPMGQTVAPLLGLALLLFPDGRLPSRRWRAVPVIAGLAIAALVISGAFSPDAQKGSPFTTLSNPVAIRGTRGAMTALNYLGWTLTLIVIALGAAATVVRLGRAHGDERQQLKLVLTVGTVIAARRRARHDHLVHLAPRRPAAADRGARSLLQRLRRRRGDRDPALPPLRRRRRHRAHARLRHADGPAGRRRTR